MMNKTPSLLGIKDINDNTESGIKEKVKRISFCCRMFTALELIKEKQ